MAEGHRDCSDDADCVLLVGCGGCDLDAVHVDFAGEYHVSCFGYHGGQCGRSQKWSCDWQAVCESDLCEVACP